jgi:polyphosphate kinase
VRSIVGRFLEHSRLYSFENGGNPEVLIGSADLMERNLNRRVETLCFVRDPLIRDRLRDEILETLLADNARAMELRSDGSYAAVAATPRTQTVSAQEELLRIHTSDRGRFSTPTESPTDPRPGALQ